MGKKNMALGVLLAVLFGPIGLLYASIQAGLIMIVVYLIILVISGVTAGFGLALYLLAWPVDVIWCIVAINANNNRSVANR